MVALEHRKSKRFSLYSIAVEISGPGADSLAGDFDFFLDRQAPRSEARHSVTLELVPAAPLPGDLPAEPAERVFAECVLYRGTGGTEIYDYHGAAHLEVNREGNRCYGKLRTESPALLHELGYLFLQSEIGRFLDGQGLHRVHGLGLGLPSGKGAIVLLPSGGGKSTLALELLNREGAVLLSDDTPLVDRLGRLYPFPLRLAFRADAPLPESWKEKSILFERRKHGAKRLVPVSALPPARLPRPEDRFRPGYLVLAERHGSRAEPECKAESAWKGALPLVRDLVVGIGVPQVAELLLSKGLRSLPGLAPAAASRSAAAMAFAARSRVLRLKLSSDAAKNAACLLEGLRKFERLNDGAEA